MATKTNLKTLTQLQGNLKLKQKTLASIVAKFQDTSRQGANKPAAYNSDQEYTDLFALGPVVKDLVEAVKSIEDEIEHLHQYIEGSIGSTGDTTEIPAGGLEIENPATGRNEEVIGVDAASGDVTVTTDELNIGDFTIKTDENGNIVFE